MSLPDTYGAQETKVYYVAESSHGVLPTSPSMLGINVEEHDPSIDPGLLKIYGDQGKRSQTLRGSLRCARHEWPLDHHRDGFTFQRKRIAEKLKNPRLARITLKTFSHWKGTMEYHRTKDIIPVMQTLGHKNIKNTLVYVHLAEALFEDQIEYVSKVAKNETDACALIDADFDYVCDFNDHKLFKKKRY